MSLKNRSDEEGESGEQHPCYHSMCSGKQRISRGTKAANSIPASSWREVKDKEKEKEKEKDEINKDKGQRRKTY
jgi:hypothetical protein